MSQDLHILKPRTFSLSDIWSGGGVPTEYTYTPGKGSRLLPAIPAEAEPIAAPEARAPHWRTRAEKMRMLDPCPELTLASERMESAERLFRAALCLFGGCAGCLTITTALVLAYLI